jgi:rhodanese-related sulfurtransferase
MERWLRDLGIDYDLAYVEDHAEEASRLGVQRSPTLAIDEDVIFHGLPSLDEFEERIREEQEQRTGDHGSPAPPPATASSPLDRIPAREHPQALPEPLPGTPGLFRVDATWGTIQPLVVADGVRTVGELEVIQHLEDGHTVVDARTAQFHERATIPGSLSLPHPEVAERMKELDADRPAIFFCNGPQCAQSPWAIAALLEEGYPADRILYYRGGMHDWITLGLPTVSGGSGREPEEES